MEAQHPRDLGLILRERRRALGLTQQELADRIGATRAWIIELEHGRAKTLAPALAAIRELGLVLDVLIAEEIEPDGGINLDEVLARHVDPTAQQ